MNLSNSLHFEPHRFQNAATHYRRGRTPYPPKLIRRVAEVMELREQHRVLDLGCGPGQLAIGFAYFCGEVIGIDPEPQMLAIASSAAEGLAPNVTFRLGSSFELDRALGSFRLVTMGRSFPLDGPCRNITHPGRDDRSRRSRSAISRVSCRGSRK
jgi:2-polyprenyl-3-methyl-5-hydroxy-6-metoxy-1,4-benzoquinol methylase